jgi:6-phosphogluconolactonase
VFVGKDAAAVATEAAHRFVERAGEAMRERGRFVVALAGGKTPRAVYERLALTGAGVDFYFGDERCVPEDDPESNYRMALDALGTKAGWRFHRIEAERKDRDAAARDYERLLPAALDVLVLGVGEDGHTASLFPGSPALDEKKRRVVAVEGTKPPPWRITITPPVISSARSLLVLATGEGKAEAVARAVEGPWAPRETPAQLARRGNWVLDAAAASRLERRPKKRN